MPEGAVEHPHPVGKIRGAAAVGDGIVVAGAEGLVHHEAGRHAHVLRGLGVEIEAEAVGVEGLVLGLVGGHLGGTAVAVPQRSHHCGVVSTESQGFVVGPHPGHALGEVHHAEELRAVGCLVSEEFRHQRLLGDAKERGDVGEGLGLAAQAVDAELVVTADGEPALGGFLFGLGEALFAGDGALFGLHRPRLALHDALLELFGGLLAGGCIGAAGFHLALEAGEFGGQGLDLLEQLGVALGPCHRREQARHQGGDEGSGKSGVHDGSLRFFYGCFSALRPSR